MDPAIASIQDLLQDQLVAAQRIISNSNAIKQKLAAQGINIELDSAAAKRSAPPTPRKPSQPKKSEENGNGETAVQVQSNEEAEQPQAAENGGHHGGWFSMLSIPLLGHSHVEEDVVDKKHVFPGKDQLKETLGIKHYQVEDLYVNTGICQAIARSDFFQFLTLLMIVANAIWIGVATDFNKADVLTDAPWWIQVGEHTFCTFFTFEIAVRFLSFRNKGDAFRDGWFVFDFILVFLYVYTAWVEVAIVAIFGKADASGGASNAMVLRIVRISRLTRVSRVSRLARLLRDVPEISVLAKALCLALRSVGATLSLLIVMIYVFAIFFTQMLSGTGAFNGEFEGVLSGMHTLLVMGILPRQADLINGMLNINLFYYAIILLYLLIIALTVANMLIGVICEVVRKVSHTDKEEKAKEHLTEIMMSVLMEVDPDCSIMNHILHSRTISKSEFCTMLSNPSAIRSLKKAGVDVITLVSFADEIFEFEDTELPMTDFVQTVLGFRDEDMAVKYQLDMKKYIHNEVESLKKLQQPEK